MDGERDRPGGGWGGSGGSRFRGGEDGWEEEEEEECHIEDLTGAFEDPEAQFNATTLSRKSMKTMYELNCEDPVTHSVEALAVKYRIRRQRVSAILVTQGMEAKLKADKPEDEDEELELLMKIDDKVVRTHAHPRPLDPSKALCMQRTLQLTHQAALRGAAHVDWAHRRWNSMVRTTLGPTRST